MLIGWQAAFKLNDAAAEHTASPMESEGIKAYRQAPADSASTAPELPVPALSAHSHFTEVPTLSTKLQTQTTDMKSAQSASRFSNANETEGEMLPTVHLSQVPLNIQQILTSAPDQGVQSEPAIFHQASAAPPDPAAAEPLQVYAGSVPAQGDRMPEGSLQAGVTSQGQQHVAASQTAASRQIVASTVSASNVRPEDSLASSQEAHTSHCGG